MPSPFDLRESLILPEQRDPDGDGASSEEEYVTEGEARRKRPLLATGEVSFFRAVHVSYDILKIRKLEFFFICVIMILVPVFSAGLFLVPILCGVCKYMHKAFLFYEAVEIRRDKGTLDDVFYFLGQNKILFHVTYSVLVLAVAFPVIYLGGLVSVGLIPLLLVTPNTYTIPYLALRSCSLVDAVKKSWRAVCDQGFFYHVGLVLTYSCAVVAPIALSAALLLLTRIMLQINRFPGQSLLAALCFVPFFFLVALYLCLLQPFVVCIVCVMHLQYYGVSKTTPQETPRWTDPVYYSAPPTSLSETHTRTRTRTRSNEDAEPGPSEPPQSPSGPKADVVVVGLYGL